MLARIYKPARNAMQSGQANTTEWVLEFEPEEAKRVDPLMGWSGSGDMRAQVQLTFATREEAVAYAERHRIAHQVFEPKEAKRSVRAYADNFKYTRKGQWTH
jgi:hypothetical protein